MTTPSDDAAIVAEIQARHDATNEYPRVKEGLLPASVREIIRDRATLLRLLHTRRDEVLEAAAKVPEKMIETIGAYPGSQWHASLTSAANQIRALKSTAPDGSGKE